MQQNIPPVLSSLPLVKVAPGRELIQYGHFSPKRQPHLMMTHSRYPAGSKKQIFERFRCLAAHDLRRQIDQLTQIKGMLIELEMQG